MDFYHIYSDFVKIFPDDSYDISLLLPQLEVHGVTRKYESDLIRNCSGAQDRITKLFLDIMPGKGLRGHCVLIDIFKRFNQTPLASWLEDKINAADLTRLATQSGNSNSLASTSKQLQHTVPVNIAEQHLNDQKDPSTVDARITDQDPSTHDLVSTSKSLQKLEPDQLETLDRTVILKPSDFTNQRYLDIGVFAKFFKATFIKTNVVVTLKKVKADENNGAKVENEAKLLQNVRHPNIVHILGVVDDLEEGEIWIVTEFLNGGPLRPYCTGSEQLPVVQKLEIGVHCWSALSYLHDWVKISHNDIKPENILLHKTSDNRLIAKLFDFGLAEQHTTMSVTEVTDRVGTYMYWAPEFAGSKRNPEKSDVYALGATLCELFTNKYFWHDPIDFRRLEPVQIIYKLGQVHENAKANRDAIDDQEIDYGPAAVALDQCIDCPNSVKSFLKKAVSFHPQRRPSAKKVLDVFQLEFATATTVAITEDQPSTLLAAGHVIPPKPLTSTTFESWTAISTSSSKETLSTKATSIQSPINERVVGNVEGWKSELNCLREEIPKTKGVLDFKDRQFEFAGLPSEISFDECYHNCSLPNGLPKGLAVLICNQAFNNAFIDYVNMRNLCKVLEYSVILYDHLTMDEITNYILKYSQEHPIKSLLVFLSSYFQSDQFIDHNEKGTNIKEFLKAITQVPELSGKPKIFIIHASRSPFTRLALDQQVTEDDIKQCELEAQKRFLKNIPSCNDVCIIHSVTPGYYNWSVVGEHGSLFIQSICEELLESADDPWSDLMTIATAANKRLRAAYKKQTCLSLINTNMINMKKTFYFMPKYRCPECADQDKPELKVSSTVDQATTTVDSDNSVSHNSGVDLFQLLYPVSIKVNVPDFFSSPGYYDLSGYPNGVALIINNQNYIEENDCRKGSQVDVQSMNELLCSLGYTVHVHQDLTAEQMLTTVQSFRAVMDTRDYHSCIVVVMTNGHSGTFLGVDGNEISEYDFVQPIMTCTAYTEKPKLFFFQADRSTVAESTYQPRIPIGKETFIMHSTFPGRFSIRNEILGSWFIQTVCDVFSLHAYDDHADIITLMVLVREKLTEIGSKRGWIQFPSFELSFKSTLTKKFHFYPTVPFVQI